MNAEQLAKQVMHDEKHVVPSVYEPCRRTAFQLADALLMAVAALEEITDYLVHEGNGGFCYEPHGTRPCSYHIKNAREALAKIRGEL